MKPGSKSEDIFLNILFGVLALCVLALLYGVGTAIYDSNIRHAKEEKVQTVCEYLDAKREGLVCIKDGKVVAEPVKK